MSRSRPLERLIVRPTTEPRLSHLWWLLFRNLAVPTLLFLVPVLAIQSLRALSFLVSIRGAIAQVGLESVAVLSVEGALAAVLTLLLRATRFLGLTRPSDYFSAAGTLAVLAVTLCLVEFLSPLEGIAGPTVCATIQIGAVVLELILFTIIGWRAVLSTFNRLNRSAQYVVALTPLLLLPVAMGGFGWRSFDPMPRARANSTSDLSRPNIILISFDALSAQDMSLYGYRLPTTPAFERLAQSSYNFVNFSSTSDLTSPAVASLLTGQYPLTNRVFELYGHIPPTATQRNLASILRARGYATAAIVTNPAAHPLALWIDGSFSCLPQPPITRWFFPGTFLLQLRHSLLYTSADGVMVFVMKLVGAAFPSFNQHGWVSAHAAFDAARQFIGGAPGPYFLWLHLYPPHAPYVSTSSFRGRFLPGSEFTTQVQYLWELPGPAYPPSQQPVIDRLRLRYDESIAETDSELGGFLDWLDRSRRGDNVILVVTADHGESFDGGWIGHGSPYLHYAETHIPLLISLPGQHQGFTQTEDADLSDIAPTLLALLGIARPPWMEGRSLLPAPGAASGPSFSMYLVQSHPDGPPSSGVVAATSGDMRLSWYFPRNATVLNDLARDSAQDRDFSSLHPREASTLMDAIRSRFPELQISQTGRSRSSTISSRPNPMY